jgi:hypothetical protein
MPTVVPGSGALVTSPSGGLFNAPSGAVVGALAPALFGSILGRVKGRYEDVVNPLFPGLAMAPPPPGAPIRRCASVEGLMKSLGPVVEGDAFDSIGFNIATLFV